MTPEQQRIAIAEACGWTVTHWKVNPFDVIATKDGTEYLLKHLPDYLNDLNAMHAVEEHAIHNLMDADEWMEYGMLLKQSHPHGLFLNGEIDYHDLATVCHVTAAQRAEAFLRTIGKWEEAR